MVGKIAGSNRGIPSYPARKSGESRLTDEALAERRLRERLALALRQVMPEYALQSAWAAYIGKRAGVNPRRVEAHMACEHRCSGADLLAYFDYFGPEFETRVRGESADPRIESKGVRGRL